MATTEEIKKHLQNLLVLKRSGELDTEEKLLNPINESLWRDSLSYDCLQSYVQHQDEEIKLNTLGLLVESKKSTLKFTSKELDLIILFLNANFKEKLEFVPLIKKALKRMKDSLAVMKRQCVHEEKMRNHYKESCGPTKANQEILSQSHVLFQKLQLDIDTYCNIFQCLRNMCICAPDAIYYRRRSSLQILLLMRDLLDTEFKHIAWKTEQVEALFKLILLDTYECNKEMAFNLIKSVDPSLLQLDIESTVCDITTVAIGLGNSIRPIDSITAAYMFKVALLSPIIQKVLRQYNVNQCCESISDATIFHLIVILLEKLKESLALAKENIVKTVTKHSLYGYIFCIRSLLQECNLKNVAKEHIWQTTVAELVSMCFEFSHSVSLIVNNSSPEGHLPMDLNLQTIAEIGGTSAEKQVVTPQMVLLCSWRTVKEVSLLFGLLTTKAPISEDNNSVELLNDDQIIRIGEYLVSLLTETKHRGAFEQAHVGFCQLCSRLWRLKKKSLNQLPRMWLHQILLVIAGVKEEDSKLCATRRSAGVPFMIQAILSTEPRQHKDTKTTTFHSVMKILLAFTQLENVNSFDKIKQLMYTNSAFSDYECSFDSLKQNSKEYVAESNDQISEIKTHALNILRAIFRHSNLAEVVNDYVADGLIAAFKSYDASTWAERNAATLLFSALIIRVFGVQRTKDHINLSTDNKMNYKLFFEKYPNLLPFILDELQTFVVKNDSLTKSNVQSILLLLSRLYHSHGLESTDVECKSNKLIMLVMHCGKSAVYETRKLAARALVPLLTEQSIGNVLVEIIENIVCAEKNHSSLNLVHGYMLQIFEIIRNFGFDRLQSFGINWKRFFEKTTWILECLERESSSYPCFLLATVYVNICNEIHAVDKVHLKQHSTLLHTLISHIRKNENLKQGPAREIYEIALINYMQTVVRENSLIEENVLIKVYLHSLLNPDMQIIAWPAIGDIISKSKESEASVLPLNFALNMMHNAVLEFHKYSPELQDALFNFLYDSLNSLSTFTKKIDICKFVLNKVRLNDKKDYYCERDSYLRLLGKSYVTLASATDEEEVINQDCINDVFNSFCDSLWITSLNEDFRMSVFQILKELFMMCFKREKYHYIQIQWWTTVLQLLLENKPEIRNEASRLIDSIPVDCLVPNNYSSVKLLLLKFYQFMCNKEPEFACAVLFYWSISLLNDTDYEMDETDVFNKCTNYDFFEPVELSKLCVEVIIKYLRNFVDNPLSNNALNWLNCSLGIEFPKFTSFRTLVRNYETYVPILEDKLHDVLDPTYKNKLLQILVYRQYKDIL